MKKGFIFIVLSCLLLSSIAVSAVDFSDRITGVIDSAVKIVDKVLGLGFSPTANSMKTETVVRLSIFLVLFILVAEGVRFMGFSQNAGRVLSLTLAVLGSFTIGPATLRAIGATWGGVTSFILLLIPMLAIGAFAFLWSPQTRPGIMVKMGLVIVIIWIASVQTELLGETARTSTPGASGSAPPPAPRIPGQPYAPSPYSPTGRAVYSPDYYPPAYYPQQPARYTQPAYGGI